MRNYELPYLIKTLREAIHGGSMPRKRRVPGLDLCLDMNHLEYCSGVYNMKDPDKAPLLSTPLPLHGASN